MFSTSSPPDIEEDAIFLLEDNWDTANTILSSVPDIHAGHYDQGASDPQISIEAVTETPRNGSNYSGINQSGPISTVDVTAQLNCWSTGEGHSEDPELVVIDTKQEVQRIVQENATTFKDYIAISTGQVREDPMDLIEPVAQRRIIDLNLVYKKEVA